MAPALNRFVAGLALLVAAFVARPAPAAEAECPNAEVLSQKLITEICWGCMFPIRMMGVSLLGDGVAPADAASSWACMCERNGIPKVGFSAGMWMPARIVEVVRAPGCSPTLGGISLPLGDKRLRGTIGRGDFDAGDLAFYNYHVYAFPLTYMLDLFVDENCFADGYFDFDVIFLSEVDPTWNNSDLAFFTQPEAALIANPIASAACPVDAVSATAGRPLDTLFWCAGSWGQLYPFSGWNGSAGGFSTNTNLLAARVMAAAHRRGLAWHTMGQGALCGGYINPMFPKSQYKWTMFFPSAEAASAHVTGEASFRWGWGRQIPGVGEDAVYVLWRWTDCCLSML